MIVDCSAARARAPTHISVTCHASTESAVSRQKATRTQKIMLDLKKQGQRPKGTQRRAHNKKSKKNANTHDASRTRNPPIRSRMPYPLGHAGKVYNPRAFRQYLNK